MDTAGYPPAVETMRPWVAHDYPSLDENDDVGRSLRLPTGYRFHPTDEELVGYYLREKVLNGKTFGHIGVVDFKCEPSKLPHTTKMDTGECEIRHYFFSPRDRKYPTGMRTDRSTEEGYWKATGKDKEIKNGVSQQIMGMKKTLVFYKGRAPKGIKTNWIMHEYRLEGEGCGVSTQKHSAWVVCRVFHKSGSKGLVEADIAAANTIMTAMEVTYSDQTNQTTAQTPATSNNSGSTNDSLATANVTSAGGSINVDVSNKYPDDAENVDPDSYGSYHKHRQSYDNGSVMTAGSDIQLAGTQGYEVPPSPQHYTNINNYRINVSTSPSSSTSCYVGQKEMNRSLMLIPSTLQQHYGEGHENQCHTPTITKTLRHDTHLSQQQPRNDATTFQDMGNASAITSSVLISEFHTEPMGTRVTDMPDMVELPDSFASPIPSWSQLLDESAWSN